MVRTLFNTLDSGIPRVRWHKEFLRVIKGQMCAITKSLTHTWKKHRRQLPFVSVRDSVFCQKEKRLCTVENPRFNIILGENLLESIFSLKDSNISM